MTDERQITKNFAYTPAQARALRLLGGSARNVLLYGGSRSGKTFVVCCALAVRALKFPGSRHAIIRRCANAAASSIGSDTLPKALKKRFPQVNYRYNRTEQCFTFDNGSEIHLIGLNDERQSEKILGKEFATLYFNECSELEYRGVQMAMTRLAQNCPGIVNRAYFDCNPPGRRHWCHKLFIDKRDPVDNLPLATPRNFTAMKINPMDNSENLPMEYINQTLATLSKCQRERFLYGNWQTENEHALWKAEDIAKCRREVSDTPRRVVVGVDPAVSAKDGSDNTGIVVVALGADNHFYVLEDATCHGAPQVWRNKVMEMVTKWDVDRVVAEVNNGGDLVEALLRQEMPYLSYRAVRAARGKVARAEPVAALYEKGLVHHVGEFPELEDEMLSFDPLYSDKSPDRMDALVWAITELKEPRSRFVFNR